MAGIINAKWDFSDVDGFFEECFREVFAHLVEMGEEAYETAVREGRYQNITGNLRSSLGYVIAQDGKIIKEGGFKQIQGRGENYEKVFFTTKAQKTVQFWARGKAGDGSEGSRQGIEYARSLARSSKGIMLIVVAGMDYASYVNSRGYDVMDSAEEKVITHLQDLR